MCSLGIIVRNKSVFVLVDVQEKFIPVIDDIERLISNADIIVKAAGILKVPLVVTEQYPEGLGKTSGKISLPPDICPIEKTEFSCFGNKEFAEKIKELGANSIVLFGIEAHICILQTALDALENKLDVYVVADAVSSRTKENKRIAIERMRQSGVFIVSTEMLLFQLLKKSGGFARRSPKGVGGEEFKQISRLVK